MVIAFAAAAILLVALVGFIALVVYIEKRWPR